MIDQAGISCMFVELSYRQHLPELQDKNAVMHARALQLKDTVAPNTGWYCDTFATLGSQYDLRLDAVFADLLSVAGQKVLEFSTAYGVTPEASVRCDSAWVNVAGVGDFQEEHIHPASHFSAVYYVAAEPGCGDLIFKSHDASTDMFPLVTAFPQQASNKTFRVTPEPGVLVIFRSGLTHMVAKNKSDSDRVSVAMNFVVTPP